MNHNRHFSAALFAAAVLLVGMPAAADSGSAKFDAAMQPVVDEYLKISTALASDKADGVTAAARALGKHAAKLDAGSVKGEHADHYKDVPAKLVAAASKLAATEDIEAMRAALKELSRPMAMWATMSKPEGVDVVYCSMAKGSWLQKPGEITNPYYGSKMLRCGEVVSGAGKGHKGGHMKHGHDKHGRGGETRPGH